MIGARRKGCEGVRGARGERRKGCKALMFLFDNNIKKQISFGGDYGKDTGAYVMSAVKNAITAMVEAIPETTIKDEENEFDARVGTSLHEECKRSIKTQ